MVIRLSTSQAIALGRVSIRPSITAWTVSPNRSSSPQETVSCFFRRRWRHKIPVAPEARITEMPVQVPVPPWKSLNEEVMPAATTVGSVPKKQAGYAKENGARIKDHTGNEFPGRGHDDEAGSTNKDPQNQLFQPGLPQLSVGSGQVKKKGNSQQQGDVLSKSDERLARHCQ